MTPTWSRLESRNVDRQGTSVTRMAQKLLRLSSLFCRRRSYVERQYILETAGRAGERGGGCLVGVTWSAMACINCVVQICTQNRCFQRRQQFVHRSLSSFICFHCRLSFDSRSLSEYCIASYSNKKRHYRGHKCIKCFSLLTLILLPT